VSFRRPHPPPDVVPAQLPADVSGFTGRTDELKQLDAVLACGQQTAAPVVSVVSGTAGVGKTSLAIHWAHRVRQRFPDGQLYVNLRGFDPGGQSMEPADAVRGFLDALAVPAQRIPSDPDAQAGLYRSRLAGRRMLIVLDNARDADQIRPLLPSWPGCFVLVTSRHQLAGLVATEGAQPVPLDMLTTMEARDLVAWRLGPDRTAAEPEALDDIVTRCGRLPLALAVVAARAAAHPGFPLGALAGELTSASGSLDALTTAEPATDPRSVFSWSYRQLSTEAARLFRLLGLHPGPEFSATASASLAACPVRRARVLLRELAEASLLGEPAPGRYAVHDLLHAYATELVHAHEPEAARRDAIHRLLDHYLGTAGEAAVLLHPHRDPIALTPALAGAIAAEVCDHAQALSWFTVEYPVLVAMIDQAARAGFDTHVWQLAWSLTDFVDKRGLWRDWSEIQHAALAAARRSADLPGQAHAHRGLAGAYVRLDLTDEAREHLGSALRIFGELGDHAGQATIHRGLSWLSEREGDYTDALRQAQRALDLFRTAGHRAGESRALNAVGWCHALLEDYGQALELLHQAIPLLQELGDVQSQALTWDSLGYAHHHLGHHRQAVTCYQHALDLHREAGHRYYEADTLTHLGDSHAAAGNPAGARRAWRTALSILDGLGHPDAEQVRQKLVPTPDS
jgi:tetratricopeptide (TPR) repeat protein